MAAVNLTLQHSIESYKSIARLVFAAASTNEVIALLSEGSVVDFAAALLPNQQQYHPAKHIQDVHERILRESMDNSLRQQLGRRY
jgi:hypothetical protein